MTKLKSQNREITVKRIGVDESFWKDIYHRLLRLSWPRFFLAIFAIYLSLDLIFAFLFYLSPGSIANVQHDDFFSYFSFSVQTMATIGYGYFYPQTHMAHLLVTIESSLGLICTALLTGLVFAKFARPSARIIFSEKALWTKQNGEDVLTLRLGNIRTNQVFQGEARMTLLRDEITTEGEKLRRLVDLKLQRNLTPMFSLSWTLFHKIDQESPLWGKSPEWMKENKWEFFVTFSGLDQDMSQTIVAHSMYSGDAIVRAHKFADMITSDGQVRTIDFSKFNDIQY